MLVARNVCQQMSGESFVWRARRLIVNACRRIAGGDEALCTCRISLMVPLSRMKLGFAAPQLYQEGVSCVFGGPCSRTGAT